MPVGPLYVLPGEVSVQVLFPFFNWIVCLDGVELCEFFMYFGDQTLARHTEINKQQVIARLWRKGNPSTLLVGMQTGTATVENSKEFPQKTKNGNAF